MGGQRGSVGNLALGGVAQAPGASRGGAKGGRSACVTRGGVARRCGKANQGSRARRRYKSEAAAAERIGKRKMGAHK